MTQYKKNLLIQFIIQELTNNEADQERFNNNPFRIRFYLEQFKQEIKPRFLDKVIVNHPYPNYGFNDMSDISKIFVLKLALSRNEAGKAVIGALEGKVEVEPKQGAFFQWEWWKNHAQTLIQAVQDEQLKEMYYDDADLIPSDLDEYLTNLSETIDIYYPKTKSELIYQTFDQILRNGGTLQQALEACNQYFEEVDGKIKLKI